MANNVRDKTSGELDSLVVILVESQERFRCSGCGNCCRSDWNIAVEPSKAERLAHSGPALRVIEAGREPFVAYSDGGLAVGRQQDDACVFLSSDFGCDLHAELGPREKPLSCQIFPYVVVPTPAGTVVSLSYFCPAVRAGQGPLLSAQREDLRVLAQRADLPLTLHGPFVIWERVTTGWAGYSVWEEELLLRLSGPAAPSAILASALAGLARSYQHWGQADLESLLEGPHSALDLALAGSLSHQLVGLTGGWPSEKKVADTDLMGRYITSLVFRKSLLRSATLLEGLTLLTLVALALGDGADMERLEQLLTHGPGAPGLALPLARDVLRRVQLGVNLNALGIE